MAYLYCLIILNEVKVWLINKDLDWKLQLNKTIYFYLIASDDIHLIFK